MGMFDDFAIHGKDKDKFTCKAGHHVEGWQTKSFPDPSMTCYYLYQGQLYYYSRRDDDRNVEDDIIAINDGLVHKTIYTNKLRPHSFTGIVHIYTNCNQCEPVYTKTDRTIRHWDSLDSHRPWVEYKLKFVTGKLVKYKEVDNKTRDELKQELNQRGLKVLEDDDPVVLEHKAHQDKVPISHDEEENW